MATILDKEITRESTIKYDNREIQVTLTADQKISMKLKGMKSGIVNISIEDLYKQLAGPEIPVVSVEKEAPKGPLSFERVDDDDKPDKKNKVWNNSPVINLEDLRSLSAITVMPMETKVLFERIIVDLINSEKARLKVK
jgi:hypothetical protein